MRVRKPLRRYPRRTFRRRIQRPRKGRSPSSLNVVRFGRNAGLNGGVDRASVVMPYRYRNTFTMSGISDVQFKLNSILDCGYTADADNAQGYLLYNNFFTRWRVHASSISITVNNSDTTTAIEPLQILLIPCTASNLAVMQASTDWSAQLNNAHAKSMIAFDGKGRTTLRHYCDISTLVGYKSFPLSSSFGSLAGAPGVDPTNLMWWYVAFNNVSGSTSNDVQYEVSIKYYVEFTEPVYEADQELARRNVLGNDFSGTKEEYIKYRAAHAPKRTHLNTKPKEEEKKEEPDYDLIKVPKSKPVTPASSSKK